MIERDRPGRRPGPVRGHERFRELARTNRRAVNGPVRVHFVPGDEVSDAVAVAYAISRRVGGAVMRNTWRRRLRAIVAEVSPTLRPGTYLIGLTPEVCGLKFTELRERVMTTIQRASAGPK